jgi:hypothetical protein
LFHPNVHLKYDTEWHYCEGEITHITNPCVDPANWYKVPEIKSLTGSTHKTIFEFSNDNLDKKSYEEGLIYLIGKFKQDKTFLAKMTLAVKGEDFSVEMISDGSFILEKGSNSIDLAFREQYSDWEWKAHDSNIEKTGFDPWSFTFTPVLQSHFCGYCESSIGACTPTLKSQIDKECELSKEQVKGFESLIPQLHNLAVYEGSKFIFEFFANGVICSTSQWKCAGTTYFTCLNNAWISQGLVNGKCGYTSSSTELSSLRKSILADAQTLDGTIVPQGYTTDCSTAVSYVYKEASAGLSNCVYSAKSGQEYSVVSGGTTSTVIMGTQTKIVDNKPSVIFQTADASVCEKTSDSLAYADMLKTIIPGDRIDFVYSEDKPHGVIFISWVAGQEYQTARVFDWNGNIISGVKTDSLGKVCTAKDYYSTSSQYCKSYRYTNYDLSIDKHPVYRIWNPVSV